MNVLYASDNNYADIMGISIFSLLENNQDMDDIRIYIINDNISDDNCKKIENIFETYGRKMPIWKKVKGINEALQREAYKDRFSQVQFARLFLEEIIDNEDDKVLYLDCDAIINDTLEELWNMPLEENRGSVDRCF